MSLPVPKPNVLARRLEDEIVLVDLETNQIYALNETGARFWELLTDGRDRATIEAALLDEFDVGKDDVAVEINRLITELGRLGLVRRA